MDDLKTLETRLKLPEGWKFSTKTLKKDYKLIDVDGHALLVQDDLKNSYIKKH